MLYPGATARPEQRSLGILLVTEIPLTLNLSHIRYLISDIRDIGYLISDIGYRKSDKGWNLTCNPCFEFTPI